MIYSFNTLCIIQSAKVLKKVETRKEWIKN